MPVMPLVLKYFKGTLRLYAVVALTTERAKFILGITPVKPMDLQHIVSWHMLFRSSQFTA